MGNTPPEGIIDWSGDYPLEERIYTLKHASLYVGVGSGLSWLAWAVGVPVVLVSGFSTPETEFLGDDIVRVFDSSTCNGCFNRRRLDPGDWNWCPDHKGTPKQFECTKSITAERVIEEMERAKILESYI
jgi:autotransporter strand-loop-strand O-heptosyltransferase